MSHLPFFAGNKPRIVGHRGAMGVAPENTLPAFQRALDDGAGFVEMDVRGTKDGQVVIIHDASLNRTTNGRGPVSRRTLSELKTLDAGYRFTPDKGISYPFRGRQITIPTLGEFFSTFPQARALVEIKPVPTAMVTRVVETICRLGKQEQVLLATEDDRVMRDARAEIDRLGVSLATGFSRGEVASFMRWVAGGANDRFLPPGQALQIPCEYGGAVLVSEQTIRSAHDLGIEMFVWTVNDVDEMARLLALGVDGIITDYPARLRALMQQGRS